MTNPRNLPTDPALAFADGKRHGIAVAALAVALVSFLNLLGAEKSILAIVLAIAAMSGTQSANLRRRSLAAIGLAVLHLVTIGIVLLLFHDELGQLVEMLHHLS